MDASYRTQVEAFSHLVTGPEVLEQLSERLSQPERLQLLTILGDAEFLDGHAYASASGDGTPPPPWLPSYASEEGVNSNPGGGPDPREGASGESPSSSRGQGGRDSKGRDSLDLDIQSMRDMQQAVREMPQDLKR